MLQCASGCFEPRLVAALPCAAEAGRARNIYRRMTSDSSPRSAAGQSRSKSPTIKAVRSPDSAAPAFLAAAPLQQEPAGEQACAGLPAEAVADAVARCCCAWQS